MGDVPSEHRADINRVKREMFAAGKGDANRSISKAFNNNYPECNYGRCTRLKMKGSDYCQQHQHEMERKN